MGDADLAPFESEPRRFRFLGHQCHWAAPSAAAIHGGIWTGDGLLCFARKNASGSINKLDRILPARFDPNVWCGRALQEAFIDLSVLRSCNGRIYCGAARVPGHVVALTRPKGFRTAGLPWAGTSVSSGGVPPGASNKVCSITFPSKSGTMRCYGAGGEDVATSSLHEPMECRDAPAERPEQVPRRPGPK